MTSSEPNHPSGQQRLLWHWMKRCLIGLCLLGTVGGLASYWAVRQSRFVPEFYARARGHSSEELATTRKRLRHDVEKLQGEAKKKLFWQASFNEEQINAWLSDQLPERFARLAARGVSAPAIAIEDGQLFAAARYQSKRWNTIISCRLSVAMTEEPNMLAIALSDLKAGALPLPLEPFVRRISKEAALGDLDIRWDFTDEGPIALVTIPQDDPRYVFKPLVIEAVDLLAGQLLLNGRTGNQAHTDYSPRGPVHRFVSYRATRVGNKLGTSGSPNRGGASASRKL